MITRHRTFTLDMGNSKPQLILDTQFFERVFIDAGAVAWPGEIDLAPDAMYAEVAEQNRVEASALTQPMPERK